MEKNKVNWWMIIAIIALLLLLFGSFGNSGFGCGSGYGMMGGFYGLSSGFLFMGGFMIIFWVLIILGVITLVRYLGRQRNSDKDKTPLDILKERYSKGEIDKKEFAEKKKDLT